MGRDNWGLLAKTFKKRGLDIGKQEWEAVVACEEGAAVALVDRLHKILTGLTLPPRASQQLPQNPSMVGPNGMVLPPGGGGGGGGFGSDLMGLPGQVASPPVRVNARAAAPAPAPAGGVTQMLPATSSTRHASLILVC